METETNNRKKTNESIAKNTLYYALYNVLNILFPLATGIYVAWILLPEKIGQVASAQNVAQYFVIASFLGIPTYALREISKVRNDKEKLTKLHSELFFINLISTGFFLFCYLVLILSVDKFRTNILLYCVTGGSIALNMLNNSWLFDGLEQFRYISIRNLFFKAIAFVLLIIFVKEPNDYIIYALITVIGTAGNYLINIYNTKKFAGFSTKSLNLIQHIKPLLLLFSVNVAIEIYSLVDITMLGMFCEDSVIAYYSYGSKIQKILMQIVNSVTMVIVPRITFYYSEGRKNEFNDLLTRALNVILVLSIPMIVGIQFVARFFICFVYGDVFERSATVLRMLSILLFISPVGYLLGSRVMLASGEEKKMIIPVGVGSIVNIIGNYFLIPHFSEFGAVIASLLSEFIVMIIYVNYGKKHFQLNDWSHTLCKVCWASVIMSITILCVQLIQLPDFLSYSIQVFMGASAYILSLIVLKENTALSMVAKLKRYLRSLYN